MSKTPQFNPFDPANDHQIMSLAQIARMVGKNTRTVLRWADPKYYAEPLKTQRLPDGSRVSTWAQVKAFSDREGAVQSQSRRERSGLSGCN